MNKLIFAFPALLCAILFSGCGHTPVRTVFPAALPPHTAETAVSSARSEALKNILAPAKIRGIGIFPAAFENHFSDEEVLNVIQACGFNRIYCQLSSEQELNERLVKLIVAADRRGIQTEIVLNQQDFYRKYRTNRLVRPLVKDYPDLIKAAGMVVEFNRTKLPENVRISGITIILEPHKFNHSNTEKLYGKLYRWDEANYGIGGDNDMLVREALETVKKISAIDGLPLLTVAIPDFLHNFALEGKISCGKVDDFLPYVSKLAIISSANLPSKVPGKIQDEMQIKAKDQQLLAVIPLASHTSIEQNRLRRRNWMDFQRTMDNFMKKSANMPAFGGVIITPLAVVEYLRQEI